MKKYLIASAFLWSLVGFGGEWVRTDKGNWREIVPGQYYTVDRCGTKYYEWDGYGNPIMAKNCRPTYSTRTNNGTSYTTTNNYGTSYSTVNNYSTSYGTINNYGDSHLTVNNYGRGRTTVNDYSSDSRTTVNDYSSGSRTTTHRSGDTTDEILTRLEIKLGIRSR